MSSSRHSVDYSQYNRKPLRSRILPYLVIAPALLITIGIMYPFLIAIHDSFTFAEKKPALVPFL